MDYQDVRNRIKNDRIIRSVHRISNELQNVRRSPTIQNNLNTAPDTSTAESSGKWASPMNQAMQKSATVNQALREGRSLQSVLDSLPKTENRMSGADYLFARAGHGAVGSVKGLVNQSDAERLYLAENAVDLANGGGFRNPKGFDALDMDAAMRVSSAFSQGLREGVDKEMILERQRQTMADRLGNRRIDNFYNKQTQKLEEAKAYQTPGVQKAGNIAEVVGQMALPVVASFLPGGQLLGTFGSSMSAAGNTTMNALEQGAETETALQAGYLTGAKEAAVESLFGGILGRGVGLLDSTGKRLLSPKVLGALQEFGNTALGRVVRKAAASGEEGLEEVLSAYLDPYIARATYDEDAGPVTFQELKDNFGMGFIVSFLLGGIPGKTNTDTNVSIDNTDTAASLLRLYEEYQQEQMQRRYQQASGRTDYVNARPVRFQASSVGGPVQPNVQPNVDNSAADNSTSVLYGDPFGNIRKTPEDPLLLPEGGRSEDVSFDQWLDEMISTETDPDKKYSLQLIRDYVGDQNTRSALQSPLSGASPNATMLAKGGMQNGQAESGRGRAVPRNGQSDDGGLGAGTDAGNPGVGQGRGGRIPGWQPLPGDSRPPAGMLESSARNQGEPDRQGSAARGGNPGLVSDSGIPRLAEQLRKEGTVAVDEAGAPIALTHWTPNMDFTEFGEGDVGFHFGSRAQAEKRALDTAGDKNTGRYIQAYLNIKNPVHMPTDQYGWNAAQAAITLWNQDIIPFEEYKRIERMAVEDRGRYNAESSKALRDLLESYGYDGIVYENEFEGEGKSYVAFHPEQVIWIDDGTGRGGDADRLNQETTDGPQDLSDADTPPTDTLALNLLHSTQEKQSVKDRVKSGVANLRRRLVNIGDSMERIDKLVGGHRNRNNYQNVIQARNRANFAIGEQGARRNGGYQTDLQGNRIGDSLADIFAPIHSQGEAVAQEFQDYLRHWHNIDRTAVKKPVFDESVTADVSREKIAEYEAAHPEFRESAEKVWAYNANLIEILVEGGVLDRGTADLLHNMYPHYVPSHVDGNTTGPYASIHNTQSGVLQKATGKKDAAAMRPIHEIMARQTINVYRQTAMNQLGNSLLDSLLSGVDGVRQYLDVTSTKSDAVDMRLGILDETLTQEDYKAGLNKDGTLTFYRNGEKTTVALSKEIIEALNGLFKGTDFFDSTTGKVLTAPATIMRNLITTYNPAFTAANFLRDAGDSLLFTKSLPHFIQAYPQAIQEILKNGELFQKYQALGGFSSGMFDSRTGAFDSGNLGLQPPGQKTKGKVKQNTVGRIEALNSVVEQIPRFTEFLATLNRRYML